MIDVIVDILFLQSSELDKEELRRDIQDAFDNNKLKFIEDFGFFTWREIRKDDILHIYIENLYIYPEKRKLSNLLFLRKFFREKYPSGVRFFYWRSRKKSKFFYCK